MTDSTQHAPRGEELNMRAAIFLLSLCLMSMGCQSSSTSSTENREDKGDDRSRLQGRWTIVSVEFEGKPWNDDFEGVEVRIEGDEMRRVRGGKSKDKRQFKLNESTNPKQIDFTYTREVTSNTTKAGPKTETLTDHYNGVYELNGDSLTIAESFTTQDPRPTSLSPVDRKGVKITVLKRIK